MFTGLIEAVGTVKKVHQQSNYRILTVESSLVKDRIQMGESIACDGACLTVVSFKQDSFVVEASQESTAKTIIGNYRVGSKVNLERAMKAGDRIGGHLVSGHIDCTGIIDYIKPIGDSLEIAVKYDKRYNNLVIEKGSIAINGISLTVNEIRTGWLTVNFIPQTIRVTNISTLKQGEAVNLEFDMIGKYISKITNDKIKTNLTREKLIESGW